MDMEFAFEFSNRKYYSKNEFHQDDYSRDESSEDDFISRAKLVLVPLKDKDTETDEDSTSEDNPNPTYLNNTTFTLIQTFQDFFG